MPWDSSPMNLVEIQPDLGTGDSFSLNQEIPVFICFRAILICKEGAVEMNGLNIRQAVSMDS